LESVTFDMILLQIISPLAHYFRDLTSG
jgi:hypothetical protein